MDAITKELSKTFDGQASAAANWKRLGSTVTLSLGILTSLTLSVGEEFFDMLGEHVAFDVDAGAG